MKWLHGCLAVVSLSFGGSLTADPKPSPSLVANVATLKEAAQNWEGKGHLLPSGELPTLALDSGYSSALPYLHFYQGVAGFLNSRRVGVSASRRIALLKEAKGQFEQVAVSEGELGFDVTAWKQESIRHLLEEYHQKGAYEEALTLLGSLPRGSLGERQVVLYGDSLRATEQMTRLRRLLLARSSLFAREVKKSPLVKQEAFWRKMLAETQALNLQAQQLNGKESTTSKGAAAVIAGPRMDGTLTQQWSAWQSELKKSFYANHDKRFAFFLDHYAAAVGPGSAAKVVADKNKKKDKNLVLFSKKFEKELKNLPPSLLVKYVKKMWDKQQLDLALVGSEIFLKAYRGHPDYPRIAYDKARLLEDSGKFAHAYKELRNLDSILMGSQYEEAFLFRRAWLAYLSGHTSNAADNFQRYSALYPKGNYATVSQYYRIKALQVKLETKPKDLAALRDQAADFVGRYPLNYYSLKLIEEYQLDHDMVLKNLQREPKPLDDFLAANKYFKMDVEEQYLFSLYEELRTLKLDDEAFAVLKRLDQRMAGQPQWVGLVIDEAKVRGDANLLTVHSLKVLQDFPVLQGYVSWQELYPRFREEEIKAVLTATKSPLPYEFVVSLIRQESAFNHKAVSSAKAQGLMQIMPATAKLVTKAMRKNSYDLFNPQQNLEFGIHILNRLYKKYDGRLDYILSAYNAGDVVTDRWVGMRGKLPQEQFIESIPYGETRDYIKYIFRNMNFYKLVYKEA